MSTSIRISGLNDYTTIQFVDFIPIVKSGSLSLMTTYRSSITSLNAFFATSGSTLSASWASASISASYAKNSSTASFLPLKSSAYQITSSWAFTSSVAIRAITASNADTASVALISISSSHAILSDSASYLYPTILYRTTCSWASNAISASYVPTASSLAFPNNSTASYALKAGQADTITSTTIPAGVIVPWAGKPVDANIPIGWLLCDGRVVLRASYNDLDTAIYVGDTDNSLVNVVWGYHSSDVGGSVRATGGSYLKIPDLRGNFIRGFDSSGSYGDTTGASSQRSNGSAVLTNLLDTSFCYIGQLVGGYGIPAGAKIVSFTSTTVTLNVACSGISAGGPSPKTFRGATIFHGRGWAGSEYDQMHAHKHIGWAYTEENYGSGDPQQYWGGTQDFGVISFIGSIGKIDSNNPMPYTNDGWDQTITDTSGNLVWVTPNANPPSTQAAVNFIGYENRPVNLAMSYIIKT